MMEVEKQDLFDKLMAFPVLRIFEPFYKKNKEILLYLFFGGLAFIVAVGSYAIFNISMGINELIANIFSWILAILFAYFTNRIWVFQSTSNTMAEFYKEMLSFFGGRIFTLVVEEAILLIFITWLGFHSIAVKVVAQIVVIVLNYIISKRFVFKGGKDRNADE